MNGLRLAAAGWAKHRRSRLGGSALPCSIAAIVCQCLFGGASAGADEPAAGGGEAGFPAPLAGAVVDVEHYERRWWMTPVVVERPPAAPAGAVAARREDLRLVAEASAAEVLPFQTVRIRCRLENLSTSTVGPLHPLHNPRVGVSVDGKPSGTHHDVAGRLPLRSVGCGSFPPRGCDQPAYLPPGRSISLSFPLVTRNESDWKRPLAFFDRPGRFHCRFSYYSADPAAAGARYIQFEVPATFRVVEPVGDDREIFAVLSAHPSAAKVLADYDDGVTEADVPILTELLERFPRSSYADYLRLALARALWGSDSPGSNMNSHRGDPDPLSTTRNQRPFGRQLSAQLFQWDLDYAIAVQRRYGLLTSDFRSSDLPSLKQEWAQTGHAPLPVKRLNDKLAMTTGTSRDRRRRIMAFLEGIDRERFPLAPVVTYYLARTLSIDDPAAGAREYERMVLAHADAYEWLYRIENWRIAPEDWLEYRIDPPPR